MTGRAVFAPWGNRLRIAHPVLRPATRDAAAAMVAGAPPGGLLAHGNGRSYGDVALNPGGALVEMGRLDRFIAFDPATGLLTCEAGVTLAEILAVLARPAVDGSGWFLPVMPGTRFVTVGGAIANDVHGKNAHREGSFGRHVEVIELARSDGRRLVCSRTENAALFAATVGGLGLTGLILSATLRLRRVTGLALETEDIRFDALADFFRLDAESAEGWDYTAAWVDCLARGARLGRGLYSRARHAAGVPADPPARAPRFSVPFTPPVSAVNGASLSAFNALYLRRLGPRRSRAAVRPYGPVLFPLDALGRWNRLYGPRGFFQFQAVVPPEAAEAATADLFAAIAASGQGSMLVVLKRFGTIAPEGLLSFPMPGTSLALDFPDRGASTRALLARLEAIVMAAGGRLYPAKDETMARATFEAGYPAHATFRAHIDPAFSSGFARRVGLVEGAVR